MAFGCSRQRSRWPHVVLASLTVLFASASMPVAGADEPAANAITVSPDTAALVEQLLVDLDQPNFELRQQAAEKLARLTADPALGPFLALRLRQAILAEGSSFEVRDRLEALLRKLPMAPGASAGASVDAIGPAMQALRSDRYVDRDGAVRRLTAMLETPELVVPVWQAMKQRLADRKVSASERHLLAPLIDRAHAAWLNTDGTAALPRPAPEQIDAWIDEHLKADPIEEMDLLTRKPAERELLDLIARDDTREDLLANLNRRIAESTDPAATEKLQFLVDFSRPAMAAEAWNNGVNTTVQYLIVGVPQYNDTLSPPRATHFDRINSQTAHCVSGNSLVEGDYPVRVAIPHPEAGREAMFYLTNLPTPRARLAYEYSLRRDERVRLAEISQRTLDYFVTRQTPLSEVEILMLGQLEPQAVSRFAGRYFTAVADARLVSTPNGLNNLNSVHAGICLILSRVGTQEAVPALEKLARSGQFSAPKFPAKIDVPWIALLAIANRDPWPKIDEWLAGLIDQDLPLTSDVEMAPELGASAAGLLLDRNGVSVRPFGLATAGESIADMYQFYGFRFTSDRDRQDVKRWWQKQQTIANAGKQAGQGE